MNLNIDFDMIKTGFIGFARLIITASLIATSSALVLSIPIILLTMFVNGHILLTALPLLVDRILFTTTWFGFFYWSIKKIQREFD